MSGRTRHDLLFLSLTFSINFNWLPVHSFCCELACADRQEVGGTSVKEDEWGTFLKYIITIHHCNFCFYLEKILII